MVGRTLAVEPAGVVAMRDRLAHRGPDGRGLWWGEHIALAHRRLAVVGIGPAGDQPMVSPCGRHVMCYNGELYNNDLVRAALDAGDQTTAPESCDTGTVLRALARWGAPEGLRRLRGMYALAWLDRDRNRLLLARDPLGIKPLYVWRGPAAGGGEEVVFASEIPAILAHPSVRARPDWAALSAYLTTIRTTVGGRTMFDGVRTLRPGEWVELDLSGPRIRERGGVEEIPAHTSAAAWSDAEAVLAVGNVLRESVRRHLRSDVPLCALLSGGLDSTIVCAAALEHVGSLRTLCAGAQDSEAAASGVEELVLPTGATEPISPDFAFAREAAAALGTVHREVGVTREGFISRWSWMVHRLGVPLSTPNEVAIYEVSAVLRAEGHVVAMSGEGADELFGGYDRLLSAGLAWARGGQAADDPAGGGEAALDAAAWVARSAKGLLLRPALWEGVEHDAALVEAYREEFGGCADRARIQGWRGEEALLQACLVHQRRVNLAGLLGRLDSAAMLAGVEGRTPLADVEVACLAEALAMRLKFDAGPAHNAAHAAAPHEVETKVALRRAFAGVIPSAIVRRPKASFPLPFQAWMAGASGVLEGSDLVRSVFEDAAIDLVRADPARTWNLAWPMLNLAMWGRAMGW